VAASPAVGELLCALNSRAIFTAWRGPLLSLHGWGEDLPRLIGIWQGRLDELTGVYGGPHFATDWDPVVKTSCKT